MNTNPNPRCSSIDAFRATVERGNRTFAGVGVRFWIKSIEYLEMPRVRHRNAVTTYTWAEVRDELRLVFPAIPLDAYDPNESKLAYHWMFAAAAYWGDPTEVLVILHETVDFFKSTGQGPWGGKVIYLRYNHVGGTDPDVASLVLPHELGHFLGLTHLDLGPGGKFYNPSTGLPYTKCDFWDQTFLPGNPPTFFPSPTSAVATVPRHPGSRRPSRRPMRIPSASRPSRSAARRSR